MRSAASRVGSGITDLAAFSMQTLALEVHPAVCASNTGPNRDVFTDVVATVGRISAGSGYDYLTNNVATSDHDYYFGAGEAPGVWAGSGAALLGLSGVVDHADMAALYGRFVDPRTAAINGQPRSGPGGRPVHEVVLGRKVSKRVLTDGTKLEPVAAFDVTFSPSKSMSVLWGLTTNDHIRRSIVDAHDDAVAIALRYLEHHAGHVRTGEQGIKKVPGSGFVVAQFRHRTSRSTDPSNRAGDPQLHSHCAILNRVASAHDMRFDVDGKPVYRWRALDSRAIYRNAHTAGAIYAATLERLLTERLGVAWAEPSKRVPMREIAGVPDELRRRFSTRAEAIVTRLDDKVRRFRDSHGREPTRAEREQMHDEATTDTRQAKGRGHTNVHDEWRSTCTPAELNLVNQTCSGEHSAPDSDLAGGRVPAGTDHCADLVFARLHEQRAWWTRANIAREVADLITDPTIEAIELETERIAAMCVILEPDDHPDYADHEATRLSSRQILDAERRIAAAASKTATVHVDPISDAALGDDQAAAVDALTRAGQQVQTIVGPAGTGKTTMLRAVAASWSAAGRDAKVLTLSAAAAEVVRSETGLDAHTIAQWAVDPRVAMPRSGLVIVDEASMVPTLVLDQLVRVAQQYGTRVALIGDYQQMGAPEAGGMLRDLAATPEAVELVTVRRFQQPWEGDASKRLRARDSSVYDDYANHHRLTGTTSDRCIDKVARAWLADVTGRSDPEPCPLDSVVVAPTHRDAAAISARCQELLAVEGALGERVADIAADRNPLHVGDLIQTRHNTRDQYTTDGRRVLNREVWRVTGLDDRGRIVARCLTRNAHAHLDQAYVERNVVLAYAVTIAGAQGRTTDTSHTLVTTQTSGQSLYVGMTRGRLRNTAHLVLDSYDHDEFRTGVLTVEAAFKHAVTRLPNGEQSASWIEREWPARKAGLDAARRADGRRSAIIREWNAAKQRLSLSAQVALADLDGAIIDALVWCSSSINTTAAVQRASRAIDWSDPTARARFLSRLRTPEASRPAAASQSATVATRHER